MIKVFQSGELLIWNPSWWGGGGKYICQPLKHYNKIIGSQQIAKVTENLFLYFWVIKGLNLITDKYSIEVLVT
jgi:hypothetical protein